MLDVLCDGLLILTTSLQLDNMEHRKERRSPPNHSPLNTPLDPCQDSRVPAPLFQLHFSHTHACTQAYTPGSPLLGPLKPLLIYWHTFWQERGLHTTRPQIFYTSLAARRQNYQHELDLIENTATQKQLCTGYPKHIMGSLQTFLLKIITLRSKSWAWFSHFFTRSHLQLSSLWHKIIGVNSFRLYYNTIISGTWNRP